MTRVRATTSLLSPKATNIRAAVAEGLGAYEAKEYEKALQMFKEALSLPPEKDEKAEKQAAFYDMACCYARLKRYDDGVDALQQAVDLGYDEAQLILEDPDLAPLRRAEGFSELIQNISGGKLAGSEISLDLEAEVRNPFRRFRQFIWGGAAIASGLGSAVSLTQTIGALSGKETIPMSQATQNLAINTAIAIGMVSLLRLELKGNDKEKEQIVEFREILANATERVKQMSRMKVSIKSDTPGGQRGFSTDEVGVDTRTTTLREFRAGDQKKKSKRIVILAGSAKFITDSLKNARKADSKGVKVGTSKFENERVAIVPVVMADPNSKVFEMPAIGGKNQLNFVAVPQEMQRWRSLLAAEFKYGFDQGNKDIFRQGIVLATDELGRVVQRGVGMPTVERWEEAFEKWWK
eukprot:CAMPEP_0184484800 /NCGR_PEP_ID=MMETSP0113_2-20130426/6475_1 /TAXON_ID=91329 /ORGANISM="Norrisiella sphaerica, Strain BC52" /LENGTH=407 /DNA_ID=CAMNT_0026865947 /DNA_START=320 /DNA_END=1543 /DNA_ORIENTATION=+